MGLIFRKSATITAPDNVSDILDTITADGYNLDDLAEDVVSELLITNFTGLVTDYPVTPAGLSRAKAVELGYRPFIAIYPAETILGIETAVINNRQRVVRVRLLEDEETIRELRLDDGVYSVTIHKGNAGHWNETEKFVPTKGGKPLDEIPFSLVTSNRKYLPSKARLSDICDLNGQHYIASSNLAQSDYWVSHPTPYIIGAKMKELSLAPGTFITLDGDGSKVRIGILEYSGVAISQLASRVQSLNNDMAKVGSRVLASEKAAVESGETLAIKTASENAALASLARLATRWINDQLAWVAWWLDLEEDAITYELNTDYGAAKVDPQAVTAMMALYQSDVISKDAFLDFLIDGDWLPEMFDREADADRIAEAVADRPPVIAVDDGENAPPSVPTGDQDNPLIA